MFPLLESARNVLIKTNATEERLVSIMTVLSEEETNISRNTVALYWHKKAMKSHSKKKSDFFSLKVLTKVFNRGTI